MNAISKQDAGTHVFGAAERPQREQQSDKCAVGRCHHETARGDTELGTHWHGVPNHLVDGARYKRAKRQAYRNAKRAHRQDLHEKNSCDLPSRGTHAPKRRDDLDASTAVMIETDKKGPEMLAKLQKFKTEIAALVPLQDESAEQSTKNEAIEKKLPLNFDVLPSEENKTNDWSYGNFHMVPSVGAITILDKYINDIRNSESIVMDELWAKAFGEKRRQEQVFTKYDVLVSPSSSYLLPGEKYTATIMLGAYNDKASNLVINVNGRSLPIVNGVATYSAIANGKYVKYSNGYSRAKFISGNY